ncbi:MAG: hypothetical protein G3M70_13540 [Candidatus Nitronauta litoralis]|uniref:Uncharacterized protein n=1 Tax=Candidatus Nitronauta litoralis TaxID=2705533 RepID=A0A7T0BXQ3_9BACT|nr:MAG: hypothetical protein G3M70_13540 [Candidatus Nitronauta litoralis]
MGKLTGGHTQGGAYIQDEHGNKLFDDGTFNEAPPDPGEELEDFITNGEGNNEGGVPFTPPPGENLPLTMSGCNQVNYNPSYIKCVGQDSESQQYETYIEMGSDDPTTVKNFLQDKRDDGLLVFDMRDREFETHATDVTSTDPFAMMMDELGGAFNKTPGGGSGGGNGGAVGDIHVYFPPNNYDDTPYQITDDMRDNFIGPVFTGGSHNDAVIDGLIEVIDQLIADGPWQPNPCVNGQLSIGGSSVNMVFADSNEPIWNISVHGQEVGGVQRGVISQSVNQLSNIGDCGVVTGDEGGEGGEGVQLPGGDAEEAPGGSTGSTILSQDGFYVPSYPADTTFSMIMQTHYSTWQQEPFIQAINSFVPTNMGNSLPSFSFETNSFGTVSWDFNNYSSVFDMMGYIVLICSTYMGIRIIITRGGE